MKICSSIIASSSESSFSLTWSMFACQRKILRQIFCVVIAGNLAINFWNIPAQQQSVAQLAVCGPEKIVDRLK